MRKIICPACNTPFSFKEIIFNFNTQLICQHCQTQLLITKKSLLFIVSIAIPFIVGVIILLEKLRAYSFAYFLLMWVLVFVFSIFLGYFLHVTFGRFRHVIPSDKAFNVLMKIKAKPKHWRMAGFLLGAIFICYLLLLYYERHILIETLLILLITLGALIWFMHFQSLYRVSYEVRDDGVYLFRNNKVLKHIPYDKIRYLKKKRGAIYVRTKSFLIDEMLYPASDVDIMFDEINKMIGK